MLYGQRIVASRSGERDVDQCLVLHTLNQLRLGPAGEDGLADHPYPLGVSICERHEYPRDDPRRVATHLGHVGEPHPVDGRAERGPEQVEPRLRYRDQRRLPQIDPGPNEVDGPGQELVRRGVAERLMEEGHGRSVSISARPGQSAVNIKDRPKGG